VSADWVIGCDGVHSRVRAAAGIGFPGVPLAERFLLADVHVDLGLPRDSAAVWLRGDGLLAAFPLPGLDLWRLMAPAPDAADVAPNAVLDVLMNLLRSHTGSARPVRACDWTSVSGFTAGSRRLIGAGVCYWPVTPLTFTALSGAKA
jgi:4,5-epoxidase